MSIIPKKENQMKCSMGYGCNQDDPKPPPEPPPPISGPEDDDLNLAVLALIGIDVPLILIGAATWRREEVMAQR